jgi:dihydrolipoamide dehydrogenase
MENDAADMAGGKKYIPVDLHCRDTRIHLVVKLMLRFSVLRGFSAKPDYDVVIIGGGPGGYYAAIRAAQLGLRTACIEKRGALGGTCLNVGCIPSKILLNASNQFRGLGSLKKLGISLENPRMDIKQLMDFKARTVSGLTRGIESLFKKYGATYIKGAASFISEHEISIDDSTRISSKNFIIATGSEVAPFPGNARLEIDGDRIVSSDHAIGFSSVPEKLVVIGGGVIGLELGSVWARLGSSVTIIEHSEHALKAADTEVAKALISSLTKHEKLVFKNNSDACGVEGSDLIIDCNGNRESIPFDKLLIATGRRPFTSGLGLDNIGITTDKRGVIEVNERNETNAHKHIFAIGDVAPGPMLAHKAEEEGMAVVDYIKNPDTAHFPNFLHIPSVIYTHPEVAWVGYTEEQVKAKNIAYRKGAFPFLANSRARCNGDTEGFVKVLVDEKTDQLIGAHVVAPHAGETIAPLVLAMTYGASSHDVAMVSHAHPTESEAVKEACLAAHFKPIHF